MNSALAADGVDTRTTLSQMLLFFAAAPWIVAIEAQQIIRVVSDDDVVLLKQHSLRPRRSNLISRGFQGMVIEQGSYYSAWDLGGMLQLSPLQDAWILLNLAADGIVLPIALRSGRPIGVREIKGNSSALPPGFTQARPGVFTSLFSVDTNLLAARKCKSVGLRLNLQRLWTDSERMMMREMASHSEQ